MCALHSTAFISLFELTKGLKLCTPVLDIFSQCHHIFPWYAKLYIYCAMAIRLYISGRPRTLLSFSIGYYIYVEYGQYTHKSGLFQTSSITKRLVLFLFRFNCVARGTCFFFVFFFPIFLRIRPCATRVHRWVVANLKMHKRDGKLLTSVYSRPM
jgi:hypothetical protein